MKGIVSYLNFNGNCEEAMTFYGKCLGAELLVHRFSEMPGGNVPPEAQNRIMHARLSQGPMPVLMASDTMPGMPFQQGNNFWVSVGCDSVEEVNRIFGALNDNATVRMPLQATFFASQFGMLTDKFGINWMLICEPPRQG